MAQYSKIAQMITKVSKYVNSEDFQLQNNKKRCPCSITITSYGKFRVSYKYGCSEEFDTITEAEQEFEKFITNVSMEK